MTSYDPKQWVTYTPEEETASYIPGLGNLYEKAETPASDTVQYDPCAPAINQVEVHEVEEEEVTKPKAAPDPRKLEFYISSLQKMIRPLSPDFKKRLSYDVICQLAHAMLDGTLFEIVSGLKDIQQITEKNLATRRMTLVNQHKSKKVSIEKRHKESIERSNRRPHHIIVLEKHHADEKMLFEENCEKELLQLDQKLVLDLDQQVSDQQNTLQRAGLPMFFITNDPTEVKLQMYVLEYISKLMST